MWGHESGKVLCAVLLLSGCAASTGAGYAELSTPTSVATGSVGAERGQAPAIVQWRADGESVTQGALTVLTPDRGTFEGRYVQPFSQSVAVAQNPYLDPLEYPNWRAHAALDPAWESQYETRPLVEYSGWLDADLRSESGDAMHCRFRLTEPHLGPAGGGKGTCELPSGETLENLVLED